MEVWWREFGSRLVAAKDLFELAELTGRPIESDEAALAAAQDLRALGREVVLVTSVRFPWSAPESVALLAVTGHGAWRTTCSATLPINT